MDINKTYQGDALSVLKTFPDKIANCCVTSPPYYGLRDYGVEGQIGLEETPEIYVERLVNVFREVKRVLRDDGTLWLNLGDSYWGGKGQSSQAWSTEHLDRETIQKQQHQISGKGETRPTDRKHEIIKPKDLIGIPWMVAFALRADGWYLRQDIIWHKPNPMPESVTDRCTKSHEYIFLLSKSRQYYYDYEAIKTEVAKESVKRLLQDIENQNGSERVPGKTNGNMKAVIGNFGGKKGRETHIEETDPNYRNGHEQWGRPYYADMKANKKSVWTIATKPFSEAHFATFPEKLIVDCIKAGCPENGIVLEPFSGSGTTPMVARKLNRNYVAIELNPKYIVISDKRLYTELGMFQ